MSHFEFFMVLAAVVVAVAMTEIVGNWGRLLRTDARVKLDWLHLGWMFYVLLASVVYWVGMLPYEKFEFVYLGQVWLLVLPTLFLVLVAFALAPNVPTHGRLDLRAYYLSKRRAVFFSLVAFILMGWLADAAITGSIASNELVYPSISIIIFLVLATTSSIAVHWALLGITLAFNLPLAFLRMDDFLSRFAG